MENPGQNNEKFYNGIFSGPHNGAVNNKQQNNADNNQSAQNFQTNQRIHENQRIPGNQRTPGNQGIPGSQGYQYQSGAAPNHGGNYKQVRPYIVPGSHGAYKYNAQQNNCAGCPCNKRSDNIALIIISVTSVIVLLIAFLATIFCLVSMVTWMGKQESNYSAPEESKYKDTSEYKNDSFLGEIPESDNNTDGNSGEKLPQKPESNFSSEYYEDLADAIRTDLDYSIIWENYEFDGNNESVMIAVDYPVLEGDVPNIEILNQIIAEEAEYFEEFFEEYSQYMLEDEVFAVYSEGCVTYMDEDTMSVVFCENIYTDYWQDCGLYCINIDMENGVVIDNSSIINVNNEFAIDFRVRSREQNGNVRALDYMTDQEIAYYLSSAGTSIVFYTPLGMEIGINYGESYVTATYQDYDQFLKKF